MEKSIEVLESPTNSLFQEPWWLEAVAPGRWDEVIIKRGDAVVARLPYITKKRYGFTLLITPNLTQTLGHWVRNSSEKYVVQLSEQRKLVNELIDNLPPFDYFHQNFHYSITDWLPFYWRGFEQTTCYTYIISNLKELDNIWKNMKESTKRQIRKAEKSGIKIEESDDIDLFLELNKLTFVRQGMSYIHSKDYIKRFDSAARQRGARKIFLAYDREGRVHGGTYLLYDKRSAYYLMGGSDPRLRSSGANVLSMWESIKFAATASQVFDFEGSMSEPIERFFRSFGAVQKPYFKITKYNSLLIKAAYNLKNVNFSHPLRKIFRLKS
jgi:lipid II:glycine glycyltransferase (peptidoglycan interpeptide bridge formation enzyme)